MANLRKALGVLGLSALLAAAAWPQTFPFFQGSSGRVGHHDGTLATEHPDRAFLRWWDPLLRLSQTTDNWEAGATPIPGSAWFAPAGETEAFDYWEDNLTAFPPNVPYVWARPIPSDVNGNYWDPEPGNPNFAAFAWTFSGLQAGDEYAVSVNLPVGPTDIDANPGQQLVYQAQYHVYEIIGAVNADNPGQPIYQRVDTFAVGSGWVRLGNDGNETQRVFTVAPGFTTITVRLLNTIPRDNQGNLTDDRTDIAVYADAARLTRAEGNTGRYVASPVVNQLQAADPFPWRVVSAKQEDYSAVFGGENKDYAFPNVTSFTHNGYAIDPLNIEALRNIVWSWPARRPQALTQAEEDRFATEKLEWLQGIGRYPSANPRYNVNIDVDNLNGRVQPSGGWLLEAVAPDLRGENYFTLSATGGATERVTYRPVLNDGRYAVEVFVPTVAGGSPRAVVEVALNGIVVNTPEVDMSTPGWKRLSEFTTFSWSHTQAANLSVAITNEGDPGTIVADQVRFIKTADLDTRSTPVMVNARVNDGSGTAARDVVVVALENGRITCMDAAGTYAGTTPTGDTRVYWTYPSEVSPDPNQVAGLDGNSGIAEMPIGFDLSSAVVESVETSPGVFEDLLYIASSNGRVYCIEMEGRGDGTTRRRWTYPNDYPSASVESTLGRITGSVTFSNTAAGPTIFVPTPQGRLYALDAVGNGTTKTTTPRWTFPGLADNPIGPITMTPMVEFNRVFFGTGTGAFGGSNTFYAIDVVDADANQIGDVAWSRNAGDGGEVYLPFGNAGPASAPAAELEAGMGDTVFFANDNFFTYAVRASDGTQIWGSNVIGSSPSSSLGFTYMRVPNAAGNLTVTATPTVMVPSLNGTYTALHANLGQLNSRGDRLAWQATLRQSGYVPSMAFGARDTTIVGLRDDDNSWMYGCDPEGFLYGFSYDPDFSDSDQTITPGEPPITDIQVIDNTAGNLDDLVNRARVQLIPPAEYERLLTRARNGTLTYADITAATTTNPITRVNYEFGESLYFMVYNLPDPAFYSPSMNYTIDISLDTPGASTQRRSFAINAVLAPPGPDRSRVVFGAWALTPVGSNALTPGRGRFRVRAVSQSGANPGTANRTIPSANMLPSDAAQGITGGEILLANPLGVSFIPNGTSAFDIGLVLDPRDPEARFNGNQIGAANNFLDITEAFSSDSTNNAADVLSHGNTGVADVYVWDRSLLTLIYGPQRGLQNVRIQLADLWWPNAVLPVKQFNPVLFPGLEDLPGSPGTNNSLDYPDIRRDRMSVAKNRSGIVENPLFQGVGLTPPVLVNSDQYRNNTAGQFNLYHDRNLLPTRFDFDIDVPRFQPPVDGYEGRQFVYVDSGSAGFQAGGSPREPYRRFGMEAVVGVDERLSVGTPTVDLGEIPGGGGFTPLAPWNDPNFLMNSPLISDELRYKYYQRFSLFNEGNVNMLNLRMARWLQPTTNAPVSPVLFFAPGLSALASVDGRWHLHSDLDDRFIPSAINGLAVLQKARPGDGEPTRFRVNPRRRFNPNLQVQDGDLLAPSDFPSLGRYQESLNDPKLAVSVPIGTPVGRYIQEIFPFENSNTGGEIVSEPRLTALGGVYEPYADPGIQLSFEVRETRLTGRQTNKARPMVDDYGLTGNETQNWVSSQPAAARDANGTLIVAFTSDRLDAGDAPNILPRPKGVADAPNNPQWRIYIGSLPTTGNVPATGSYSNLSDLSTFRPATNSRWFLHNGSATPTAAASVIFGVPAAQIDPNSVAYLNPAFPAAGTAEPLSNLTATGKTDRGSLYMAFIGQVDRAKPTGERVKEYRLLISNVTPQAGGGVTVTDPIPLTAGGEAVDPTTPLGRPSIVQSGNNATVFYTASSGSGGQILWSHFDGNDWINISRAGRTESLGLGVAFDSTGSPSATLRRYQGGRQSRINLTFTGRIRGRTQTDVYMMQMVANGNGIPQPGQGGYAFPFATRAERLEQGKNNLYWAQGAEWRLNNVDLDAVPDNPATMFAQTFIDIKWLDPATRQFVSILDHNSRTNASGSRVYVYKTIFGGQAYIDTAAGSIRFSGAILPRNAALFIRYTPRFLRVSEVEGMNYRTSSLAFDERYIADSSFWALANNLGAPADVAARNDRFLVTYLKTASTAPGTSQPYMKSMRFGYQLPYPVRTLPNGRIANLQVTGANSPYQIEPSTGKLYFMAGMEDQAITVTYDAVDSAGQPINGVTVGGFVSLITESTEVSVPMGGPANESALALALDPQSGINPVTGQPYNGAALAARRAPLVWMFWTSTRGGGADVYFQTVAPRYGSRLIAP